MKKQYWINTCRHFTNGADALNNKSCLLGIAYDSVTANPNKNGSAFRCACRTPNEEHGKRVLAETGPAGTCEKFDPWTLEEIEKNEAASAAAFAESLRKMNLVAPIISAMKKKYKGRTVQGVKTCPVCKGKLHMSHSGYNGHVWGRCETEGCLNWME
jgi:hypothetical protein